MFKYFLTSEPKFDIDKNTLDLIFKISSNNIPKEQNGIVNVVFLDDGSIKKLNNQYRGFDKTTDVLSFHYYDDFASIKSDDIAGEIILSESMILLNSVEYGLGTEKEFYKLIIHSILHLVGYNHETDSDFAIMDNFEKNIWKKVFEK